MLNGHFKPLSSIEPLKRTYRRPRQARTVHRVVVPLPQMYRTPEEPYCLGVRSFRSLSDACRLVCLLEDACAWLEQDGWRRYLLLLAEMVRPCCHRLAVVSRLLLDAVDFTVIPQTPAQILTLLASRLRPECRASRAAGEGCYACARHATAGCRNPEQAARRALRKLAPYLHLVPTPERPLLAPDSVNRTELQAQELLGLVITPEVPASALRRATPPHMPAAA